MAQAISEKDFEKAMTLRDPEFCESLEGFIATSTLYKEKQLPREKVSMRRENALSYLMHPYSESALQLCSKYMFLCYPRGSPDLS